MSPSARPGYRKTKPLPSAAHFERNPPPVLEATAYSVEPDAEEIARLAYSYWQERGCQGGSAEEDWLRAEQALRAR